MAMGPTQFTMTGPTAELWIQGRQIGTLQQWTLQASSADEFTLDCQVAKVDSLTRLPDGLRPPLELRLPFAKGVLVAPVIMVSERQYRGLARPQVMREVMRHG